MVDKRDEFAGQIDKPISRRAFAGMGALIALCCSGNTFAAARAKVEELIRTAVDGREQRKGRVLIDLPVISENGAKVLIGVSAESPMTKDDHVTALHLFATENPNASLARFHLTPALQSAQVVITIRLAKSQTVVALAQMSDGSVYRADKYTTVTIGGCGGAN